jgi:acyl-CoA reductase-like NAD-dependent aldehyde dehydrogenase
LELRSLIDGQMIWPGTGLPVIDPATGVVFAEVPAAGRFELDRAVVAARRAFPAWSALCFPERRAMLYRFAARIRETADEIAPVFTREHGKPIAAARAELLRAADFIEALSSLSLPEEEDVRTEGRNRIVIRYRPLGVVAAIAPWNAPVVLAMHKLAHALYTGNCLVLKPAPTTPLATLAVAALAADIFPAGVLNILAGGNDLGAWLVAHPDIDKVSFTGSVESGRKVMAEAGHGLKRATLELGGNDPAIVLDDADLDVAAAGIAGSAFANCGQICMAVKRVYVAASLHDALVERIAERARAIRIGPGHLPDIDMGPLQNRAQFEKVSSLIEATRTRPGACFVTGGTPMDGAGYFVRPAVVTGLDDAAPLVADEQFGPVLPILRFEDEEDAVRRANAGRFGLGASVWSKDVARAGRVASRIEAGSLWINQHGGSRHDVPFGGAKDSGIGHEHGVSGLRSYMQTQVVSLPG